MEVEQRVSFSLRKFVFLRCCVPLQPVDINSEVHCMSESRRGYIQSCERGCESERNHRCCNNGKNRRTIFGICLVESNATLHYNSYNNGGYVAGFLDSPWSPSSCHNFDGDISCSTSGAAASASRVLCAEPSQAFLCADEIYPSPSSVTLTPGIFESGNDMSKHPGESLDGCSRSTRAYMTNGRGLAKSNGLTPDSGFSSSSSRWTVGNSSPFSWLNRSPTSPKNGVSSSTECPVDSFDNSALVASISGTSGLKLSNCHAQRSNRVPTDVIPTTKYPTSIAPPASGYCSFQSPNSINSTDSGVEASFTKIVRKPNLTQSKVPASHPSSHHSTTTEFPPIFPAVTKPSGEEGSNLGYETIADVKLSISNLQRQMIHKDAEIRRKTVLLTKTKADHHNVMSTLRTAQLSQKRSAAICIERLERQIRELMMKLASEKKLLRKGRVVSRKKGQKRGMKPESISDTEKNKLVSSNK